MLVEQRMLAEGRPAFVLDGDNWTHGPMADLGFTLADRAENLRRLVPVAALIAASGLEPPAAPELRLRSDRTAWAQADRVIALPGRLR